MIDTFIELLFGGNSSRLLVGLLAAVTTMACATSYSAIGLSGFGPLTWRAFSAAGWSLLVIRFVWAYWADTPPTLPPLAALSVMLIACGAIMLNLNDSSCEKFHGISR